MKEASIALGTWSWGAGAAGGDQVFGNHKSEEELHEVFDAAMAAGLNLWDTATVYGMGASEDILGKFVRTVPREDIFISTKFTPQIAGMYGNDMETMLDASLERLGTDYVDLYWIHNPEDGVERWTADLGRMLKTGKVRRIGVTNPAQVADAAAAAGCKLTAKEMAALEEAARETGVNTRGGWERPMV